MDCRPRLVLLGQDDSGLALTGEAATVSSEDIMQSINRTKGLDMRKLLSLIPALALLAMTVSGAQASGGTSSLTVSAGTGLTVTGAAPGNFTATLAGSDQTIYTSLAPYTGADTTGTGKGWNVTFQATQFACTYNSTTNPNCPTAGNTLPASSLKMAAPTVACASNQSCTGQAAPPSISISANTAVDSGTAVKVASAAASTGMGTYDFTPSPVDTTTGHDLSLTVPSYVYAAGYSSTLTVSIISGP